MPQYIPKADIDVVFRKGGKIVPGNGIVSGVGCLWKAMWTKMLWTEVCRQAFRGSMSRLSHIEGDKYTLELFHRADIRFQGFRSRFYGSYAGGFERFG